MIELRFPGQVVTGAALGASVEGGMLVLIRQHSDLQRLIELAGYVRSDTRSRSTTPATLAEPSPADDLLRHLIGLLISGRFPAAIDGDAEPPTALQPAPKDLHAENPFDALLLALIAIADLWPAKEDRLVLCLALSMPGESEGFEVSMRFDRPRAALWVAPGSLLAGISVGTLLKAGRWCAAVAGVFTSASADAAASALVDALRDQGAAKSRHGPLPRLDAFDADRKALRGREVLVVLLHGLFGTDAGTFDEFITRLTQATPLQLEANLSRLASSAPLELVRSHSGVDRLSEALRETLDRGGERLRKATAMEVRPFIERHVGWVGWPHDSLAPIDTCATDLAALLEKEFSEQPPQHIVFVAHSQGGLLARAACVELAKMNSPAAQWKQRIAAIATFGTPHRGAAIAEPGGKGGREMALYLMMLSGTGKPSSLGDVLALLNERTLEGIEDLKAFNASTRERENAYVQRLLKDEFSVAWPNGKHRPDMLLVGGKLGPEQKASWRDRAAAAFIGHKLRHDDHDLVVELKSSVAANMDARVALTVASDHFGYFSDSREASLALDAAVALVWTLLGDRLPAWAGELEAADKARSARMRKIVFKTRPAGG
jgi:triacylglycerol esterase/lipase EstA (alpha/beta hydrolase family)